MKGEIYLLPSSFTKGGLSQFGSQKTSSLLLIGQTSTSLVLMRQTRKGNQLLMRQTQFLRYLLMRQTSLGGTIADKTNKKTAGIQY